MAILYREDLRTLAEMWSGFAEQYANVDREKATRFRRLAGQMNTILANDTVSLAPIKSINLMAPEPPPKIPKVPKKPRKTPAV